MNTDFRPAPSATSAAGTSAGRARGILAPGNTRASRLPAAGRANAWRRRTAWGLLLAASMAQAQLGDPTVTQAASGEDHTCALTSAGAVKCWGLNEWGQLGSTVTTATNAAPLDVQTLGSGVAAIAAGYRHTCALTDQGAVKCWGSGGYGRLGSAAPLAVRNDVPLDVQTLGQGVVAIAAGEYHTCALTDRGAVKCWGWNMYGQLGSSTNTGTQNANASPLDVQTLGSGVVAIAAGQWHTCALTHNGAVKCWGINDAGQLGSTTNLGTGTANASPLDVQTLASGAVGIAAGQHHTCAVFADNTVKCWGLNTIGQLGNPTNSGNATPNASPLDVWTSGRFVATGAAHACAANDAGAVRCWGSNQQGQLGQSTNAGTTNPNSLPAIMWNPAANGDVRIGGLATGTQHTCGLTTTGGLFCWGASDYGKLGRTTSGSYAASPGGVQGLSAAQAAQSIAFAAPQKLRLRTSLNLDASASSGLPVVFDTWTPNSCVVNGTTLSPAAGAGDGMLCGVRASQPGAAGISRAAQQLRVIRIVREDRLSLSVAGQGSVAAAPAPLAGNGIAACTAANSPCTASYVAGDATSVTFTATPAAHWHLAAWNGHCTASGANPLQASASLAGETNCSAVFAIDTFTVSAGVTGGNGTIAPASRTVNYGATTTFTVTPANGYQATASGCGGSLSGNTYTTGIVTANCAVTASFAPLVYSVTAMAGANGSITPPSRTVNHGATTTFTVTPTNGYQASASGCGGNLSGNTYTTGIVTANCTVTASFATLLPSLSLTITADRDFVRYGQVLSYAVTLSNTGTGAANPASIALALPPQLDAAAGTWTCTNGGAGAQCTAAGSGALQDNAVVLAAGRSLTWLVAAPVRADASGGDIVTTASASAGAITANASDRVILVLMRDGFDGAGNSAQRGSGEASCVSAAEPVVTGGAFERQFALPVAASLFDTVLAARRHDGAGLRIARANLAAGAHLQLIAFSADGQESASAWTRVDAAAPSTLATFANGTDPGALLLAGPDAALFLPLPASIDGSWRIAARGCIGER